MEDLERLLTRETCEAERTQADLHTWVHSVLLASSHTPETRDRFRLRQGFLEKKFMEEIWPISLIADHCYRGRNNVFFRSVLGDQGFDAEILDRSSGSETVIPVEFTQAAYDEEMYHRMLYIKEHRHVPLTGPVIKTGTKRRGITVKVELEAVDHDRGRSSQFEKIEQAARRKAEGERLPETRLGIVYEGLHISDQEDFDLLRELAVQRLSPLLGSFAHLYLIRSEGDHVLQLSIKNATTFQARGEDRWVSGSGLSARREPIRQREGNVARRVFHTPHRTRVKEARFAFLLCERLGATYVKERFQTPASFLKVSINGRSLAAVLDKHAALPKTRRQRCVKYLQRLPDELYVATEATDVSFDLIVEDDGRLYFWEFHEEQHRNLKDARPRTVYDAKGKPHIVPRYLQRLVRDLWRIQSATDLTVVWWDWFEEQNSNFIPTLRPGFREYRLQETFSFDRLRREAGIGLRGGEGLG